LNLITAVDVLIYSLVHASHPLPLGLRRLLYLIHEAILARHYSVLIDQVAALRLNPAAHAHVDFLVGVLQPLDKVFVFMRQLDILL